MNEVRQILERAHASDRLVSADLLPLLYDELRHLAATFMARQEPGSTLQPTALVHEAWLRLTKAKAKLWNNRAHFFRAAAQAMRCILADRARAKASLKHGTNVRPLSIDGLTIAEPTMDERILLVDEALDLLEKENPEGSRLVTLKFFGGLTNKEIATMEGVTERTVERRWMYAKVRLFQMIQQERSGLEPRWLSP